MSLAKHLTQDGCGGSWRIGELTSLSATRCHHRSTRGGRGHPFFAGFDVVRALSVMLAGRRSADIVMLVPELGAVVSVLLRRVLGLGPPVAPWDVSADEGWRPRRYVLRFVLPRVDRVLALSRHHKAHVEATWRPRAPAELIGYSVDEVFFRPSEGDGQDDANSTVLSVGDDWARDFATLVEACVNLPVRLVLETRQPVVVPPAAADRIQLMPQRLSYRELRDLYAASTIVVLLLKPSAHPRGITTLFEAMAMGRPVVVPDVGMTNEFVTHDQTRLLVPPGDAAALREAIAGLLADPARRRRLGANARAFLEQHLSMEAFAGRLAASPWSLGKAGART